MNKVFIIFFMFLSMLQMANAQQLDGFAFVQKDIFQTAYFIENKGQFESLMPSIKGIKYAVNHQGKFIYFTNKGCTWHLRKYEGDQEIKVKASFKYEEEEKKNRKLEERFIEANWVNANEDVQITCEEKSRHYFSYGGAEFKSYGYKKIRYNDIYPNIDIEYILPEKGGIKYTLIVKQGGKLSDAKLAYHGDVKVKHEENKLVIENDIDPLLESELNAFYEDGTKVACRFTTNGNEIGFEYTEATDNTKIIIVDPWVTTLTTLNFPGYGSVGYDIDFDYEGNAYVFGGGYTSGLIAENTKVAKYSPTGILLWTFNGSLAAPLWEAKTTGGYFGNMVVDKWNDKIYVSQGVLTTGPTIVRLKSDGSYDGYQSPAVGDFQEFFELNFNCQTGDVLVCGGSMNSTKNTGVLTQAGTFSSSAITSFTQHGQDIVHSAISPSGEVFVTTTTGAFGAPSLNNVILKLNGTFNGNQWIVPTGYSTFGELLNKPYLSTTSNSNGYNALYANNSYLFYYDGSRIKAFDKLSGAAVGTAISIASHPPLYEGGIYADECNNVYIGGNGGRIRVYKFNGVNFTALPPIVFPGMTFRYIHDLKFNPGNNMLYVCGDSIVAAANRTQLCGDTSVLNTSLNLDCNLAIIDILGGSATAKYDYVWTDSNTNTIVRSQLNAFAQSDTLTPLVGGHVYILSIIAKDRCGWSRVTVKFKASTQEVINLNPTVCSGLSYTYNGVSYSSSGLYIDTLANAAGCDTLVNINLTVTPPPTSSQNVNICYGQSITVNGNTYTASGSYIDTLTTSSGCDSLRTTNLAVDPIIFSSQSTTICFGDTLNVNGQNYVTSGVYTQTYTAVNGCDSFHIINLTVRSLAISAQNIVICDGQSITINGNTYTTSGTYIDTFKNAFGCDSFLFTNLTASNVLSSTQNITICEGNFISVNGNTYYATGIYLDTIITPFGCDSVITTNLIVNNKTFYTQTVAICQGDTLLVNSNAYTNAGTYKDTLINSLGCDSIITTNLFIRTTDTFAQFINLCPGQTYQINNNIYNQAGVYIDTIRGVSFCDSVVITTIRFNGSSSQLPFIANAFSPNNDDVNDCFGLPNNIGLEDISFQIYNRFGQQVFATTQVWDCWSGNYKGVKADVGVYYYLIKGKSTCGEVLYKGNVTLIR